MATGGILPLLTPRTLPSDNPSSSPSPERLALVVDDNTAIGTLLKVALERHKIRALTFADPLAALAHLDANRQPVEFAIVDVNLGGNMDGLAFAQRLRGFQPGAVVVFSTGRNLTPEQREFCDQAGALFLPKPFHLNQLGGLIAAVEKQRAG